MGWMYDLYQTYENNLSEVGEVRKTSSGKGYMLLPISHVAQDAQIEVTVDNDGNFFQAKVVSKDEAASTIPCTEDSANRTAAAVPHPLHDKLMYVAGDYEAYGGVIKKGAPYQDYLKHLSKWVSSPQSHDRIKAIYHYIRKGCLIEDLVAAHIITLDKEGKMIPKWSRDVAEEYGDKPELFEVISGTQDAAFVRFNTYTPGSDRNIKVWEDKTIFDSYISFNESNILEKDICYITGDLIPQAGKHVNGLRRPGDQSKLISANDTSGYTYRGRFKNSNEVMSVGYQASQKAHNALKWLIRKQGKTVDGRVFLVWGNNETDILSPQEDGLTYLQELGVVNSDFQAETDTNTHELFATEISKAIDGYKSDLTYNSTVIILILDAATSGRLSILYYYQLDQNDYLEKIKSWHQTCTWRHRYRKTNDKKSIVFHGAPATKDIVLAAYGTQSSDKLIKDTMQRLLPCIISGQKLPIDIVNSAFNRAVNPVSTGNWEWEKTLSITCALFNKHYEKESYSVSLDVNNKQRDYLFGRLLAVADVLERRGLGSDEQRASNAIRYMNAFAKHPARTWQVIQANLQPYQAKLGAKAIYHSRLIDEIASNIKIEDFNNKPLSGKFLLGFYSQRHELYKSKEEKEHDSQN